MNIVDWAVSTMNSLGAFGVFLLIFLENLSPPRWSSRWPASPPPGRTTATG